MSDSGAASGGPVRPVVALALAVVSFVALLIFGFGMLSLALNEDVIQAPGLGQAPGVVGVVSAMVAFAITLWMTLRTAGSGEQPPPGPVEAIGSRRTQGPRYTGALWAGLACTVGYVVGVWVAAVLTGADVAVATAVAGRTVTSWFGLVILAAGAIAGWGGIALVRTRAARPRWPWEDEFDE